MKITDTFQCPVYPDLSPIPYHFCLLRQRRQTPAGNPLYPECANCETGKNNIKNFKFKGKVKKVAINIPKIKNRKRKK